jgi:hypothetical protein
MVTALFRVLSFCSRLRRFKDDKDPFSNVFFAGGLKDLRIKDV